MTIEFIQTMLDDSRLDDDKKIEILDDFSNQVHDFIRTNILDNSKLTELTEILNFINGSKKALSCNQQ